ncbi:hypothetical protein GO308_14375 [Sphingomonas sp. SFZ2018-12]|uniref:hypothetical protein n=1 Tax=Sphingomonas sp. SFZ2018-12 TaxID=2683197 RepID=UPI001F0EC0CE|nr:hypothetical protein [Sphingomonas sp. SFZ2018-12]MCH4894303.1 hypothetical protein [Sphingomonas sp. SFZ2018-12]
MQIVCTRTRSAGAEPLYQYLLLVPFDQLSYERQDRIHYRTDFGGKRHGGPHARLPEVIAPIDYLRLPPGLEKHRLGGEIYRVGRRIEALLVAGLYPEMSDPILPTLFRAPEELDDGQIFTRTDDLTGRFVELAARLDTLTVADLGLDRLRKVAA